MVGRLEGKVAIVTGAGTGIGEAIAKKFAREGARVVVNGLPGDPVDDVVRAIRETGGEAVPHAGDVSQEVHAESLVRKAIDEYRQLDVVVNNAGVFLQMAPLEAYDIQVIDETLRMNVRSAVLVTKFALPHLQKSKGNVICAGSESGVVGLAENAVYGGSKGFLHAFTKGIAVEQAKHGVRANCVCPGAVDTAWTHKETGPMDAKMEKLLLGATPLGRRATVEEIANVYAFLASDEASYVTGALWLADGGITIAKGPVGEQAARDVRKEPPGTLGTEHTQEGLRNKPVRR